jgi:iron only hydrogenase large subunit-like protein/Na+-translocating ferredoxin:NAD+ oxidoreductase RNF subunit RnfB
MCVNVCPQEAKVVQSDVEIVKQAILNKKKVIASIAPSFVANYSGFGIASIRIGLKKLGFWDVMETAVGATIVKDAYDDFISDKQSGVYITSCCPTVNMLITKHYPIATKNLLPIISPMEAHAATIKKQYPDAFIVFIGPCISKKKEADESSFDIDAVMTFKELQNWLDSELIQFEPNPQDSEEGNARIFPVSGGILKSMQCANENFDYLSLDGIENIMFALDEIIEGHIENCIIEMSACSGGCIGGPASVKEIKAPLGSYLDVKKSRKSLDFITSKLNSIELSKPFVEHPIHTSIPSDEIIQSILKKMGKTSKTDELNCGSCGYNSCREKAIALYNGKAEISMCLPYLKEKAESFTDGIINNTPNAIIVLNESMEIQLLNHAACHVLSIEKASELIGQKATRVLDITPYETILKTKETMPNMRRYLAEYDKFVDETIIYDFKFHLIMIIMRDVTEEERTKLKKDKLSKQTIEVTDKIIEKQMKAVQEIASLLGESTAEVKVAIYKLKESLENE